MPATSQMDDDEVSGRRTAIAMALMLLLAALGLGLVGTPGARASCVGPQLSLEHDGSSIAPRQPGSGDDERRLVDVTVSEQLRMKGSNLTFDCFDTYGSTSGCRGPAPAPRPTPAPVRNAELVFTQDGHRLTLVSNVPVSADLTAEVDVRLPVDARPGPAQLIVQNPQGEVGHLDLLIH